MFPSKSNLVITGGTYTYVEGVQKEFDLHKHIAIGALLDSSERFNPPRCHPETRGALLAEIMEWVTNPSKESFLLWLYGPIGSGKSALAQSIAEHCQARGLLAASFFFSRMSAERNHEKHLAATIAYQLGISRPEIRGHIDDVICGDPSIFGRSLQTQFQKLVVGPVSSLVSAEPRSGQQPKPELVIIDALDECHDPKVQRYILSVIDEELHRNRNLPLRFIVTSRPEEHISMSFKTGNLAQNSSRLSLENYFGSYDDVRAFFQSKFQEITREHPLKEFIPPTWPSQGIINSLVRKSSGQFVYAAAVIEYVSSVQHRPTERLDVILGLSLPDGDSPFSELDTLYKHVFSSVKNVEHALRIFSAVLLMDLEVSPEVAEKFLLLKPGDTLLFLSGLASVISFQDRKKEIKLLHASLSDFLLDVTRSEEFYIDTGKAHAAIARCCLQHLETFEDPLFIDYTCYNFEIHFDLAHPTQELLDAVINFQLVSLYKISKALQSKFSESTLTLEDLWYFIPTFFDCIENSIIFKDARSIYEEHLRLFDAYISTEFDQYCGDDRLNDLVTVLTICHSPITAQNLDDVPLCKDALFQLNGRGEHLALIDENCLNLRLMVRRHSQSEPYIELLCQFLEDPGRSGRHFIDGERYARAALRCARHTTRPPVNRGDESGLKTFMWSLECTPALLLRAAHHEELVAFLKDYTLESPPSQPRHSYYPILARMMREASLAYLISSYLRDKDQDTSSSGHVGALDVIPQGLRISLFGRSFKKNIPIIDSQNVLINDAAEIANSVCCSRCLIAYYFSAENQVGHQVSESSFIVRVDDPFPEIDPQFIDGTSTNDSNARISGIMRIVAYRVWKQMVQKYY